jgi:isoleucyl-tRNA synthetase
MAGRCLSRRLRPAPRLVPFLAARKLRTRGRAPYDAVITHGFTMAEDGRKMSKSLNNQVFPQDVMKESGADILRLWVMNTDYWEDQRLGKTVIKTNIDAYRKLRNTIRWMLGTLAHDDRRSVDPSDMPELERLMLHRLSELDQLVRTGYDNFDFKRISRALTDFANIELSAFYFDIRKDALYCDAPSSLRRKASLQVIRTIFDCLVTWLAPMLPFTMEEAWLSRKPDANLVHLEQFPEIPAHGATRRWPPSGRRSAPCAGSSPALWKSSAVKSASAPRWRPHPWSTSPIRRWSRPSATAISPRSASPRAFALKPVKALTRPSASMM